jgi:hypothetical protein
VSALLEGHLSRRVDHKKALFTMLSLDLWCDRVFGDGAPVPVASPCRSEAPATGTSGAGTGASPISQAGMGRGAA